MFYFSFYATEVISYLAIPITAALVGWGTNILAIRMTFYPLEFQGIPPYLGWQGIIPNKSKSMAEKSVDMIARKLINFEEQFDKLEPEEIASEMGPSLDRISRKIVDEVMKAKAPRIWHSAPQGIKQKIYHRTTRDLPHIVAEMMTDVQSQIEELFDLKAMVVNALVNDKQLLNEIFLECGKEEFKFIKKSGIYFGGLFGFIQMSIWYFFQPWWFLPLAGLLVGYSTNWIALRLIFSPLHPKKIGFYTLQGLFIKRQEIVAADYAKMVSKNIITSEKIFEALLDGPRSEKLADLIGKHIRQVVDQTAGEYKPLLQLFANPQQYEAIKNIAAYSFMEDFPIIIRDIFDYTERSLDIENTLRERMRSLSPEDFSGFLRPVFQEDEWKLILVGALLGLMAGFIQFFVFF